MKKTYMIPELQVVKIETQGMLALSGGLDKDMSITDPGEFGSREFEFEPDFELEDEFNIADWE